MNAGRWILKNLALPIVLVLVGGIAGGFMQTREIDAHGYRLLRNTFKVASSDMRAAIAGAMRDGRVKQWEFTDLAKRYWMENNAMVVDRTAVSVAEERLVLAAMTRQVKTP